MNNEINRVIKDGNIKEILKDKVNDYWIYMCEIKDEKLVEDREEWEEIYNKIKGLLYNNKINNSLRKHMTENISKNKYNFILDKRIISDEEIEDCDNKIRNSCKDYFCDVQFEKMIEYEEDLVRAKTKLGTIKKIYKKYDQSIEWMVKTFNSTSDYISISKESMAKFIESDASPDDILSFITKTI